MESIKHDTHAPSTKQKQTRTENTHAVAKEAGAGRAGPECGAGNADPCTIVDKQGPARAQGVRFNILGQATMAKKRKETVCVCVCVHIYIYVNRIHSVCSGN